MSSHGYTALRTSKVSLESLNKANEIHEFPSISVELPRDGSEWVDPLKQPKAIKLTKTTLERRNLAALASLATIGTAPLTQDSNNNKNNNNASTFSAVSAGPELGSTVYLESDPLVFDDQSRPGTTSLVGSPDGRPGSRPGTRGSAQSTRTTRSEAITKAAERIEKARVIHEFQVPENLLQDDDRVHKDTFAPIQRHLMEKPREYHDEPTVCGCPLPFLCAPRSYLLYVMRTSILH